MKWLLLTIWYFAIGSAAYLLISISYKLDVPQWIDDLYYLWEATKDLAFFICFSLLKEKDIKDIRAGKYDLTLIPTGAYFAIRLLWAIIKPLTTWAEDHPIMVLTIFTAQAIIVIMFLWIDLRKRAREL